MKQHEVFTTVPGLVMEIGTYGVAMNEGVDAAERGRFQRAIVPHEVAVQIEDEIRGWRDVEVEEEDPDSPGKTRKVTKREKFGRGPSKHLKVVAIDPTPAPKASSKDKAAQSGGKE